jgi:hypothetical protein
MKRFLKAYLTIAAIGVVIANLVLILLYGRQFYFSAASDAWCNNCSSSDLIGLLIWFNLVLVAFLVFVWLLIKNFSGEKS